MTANELYEEALLWQSAVGSLLGSLLGLCALLLGAWVNYRLNRRRDTLLRREEVKAIAASLYAEALLLRDEIALILVDIVRENNRWGLGQGGMHIEPFGDVWQSERTLSEPAIYTALAAKFGMLPAHLVLEIGRFHHRIQQVRIWLPKLQEHPDRLYTYSTSFVLEPGIAAVNGIEPFLREIEGMLVIKSPSEKPDIREACDMLQAEKEAFEQFS